MLFTCFCIPSNASTENSCKLSKTLASISRSQEITPPNLLPWNNKKCTTPQFHLNGTDACNTTTDGMSLLSQVQITDGKHCKSFSLNSLSGHLPPWSPKQDSLLEDCHQFISVVFSSFSYDEQTYAESAHFQEVYVLILFLENHRFFS